MIWTITQPAFLRLLLLACLLILVAACGSNGNSTENDNIQIALIPAAGGIGGEMMGVQLTDTDDNPITDATVALEGNMNHAGMVPVIADAVTDDADGTADGIYQIPFKFTMLGDWILTVTVEQADGTTVTRDIDATVGADEVTSDAMPAIVHDDQDMAAMAADGLQLHHIMAAPMPMAGGNGAVYLTIANPTDADEQLIGAATNIANAVELHETINDNNVMRMEPRPDGFVIPAGEELVLEPGGKHIMLIGLAEALAEGDTFTLTLQFAQADPMTVDIAVMDIAAADHSGHNSGQ